MKKLFQVRCTNKSSAGFPSEMIEKTVRNFPGELPALINFVCARSPYINRLVVSELGWLSEVLYQELDQILDELVKKCKENIQKDPFFTIRVAKRRAVLVISLADFGNILSLAEVTHALSIFAERIVNLVMDLYAFNEFQRVDHRLLFKNVDSYPTEIEYSARNSGLTSLGMGKLGSMELNYSSDIDLIFLFDEEKFKPESYSKIRNTFIIIIRQIVKALSEVTSDGYVFRVDLRLRPDPSTNPICIGALAAQRYYENFGRNWERAAFIKARCIAGDHLVGQKFLTALNSFIWRKNLDFAAIDDINDIRKKIRKKNPKILNSHLCGYNIKTGIGGIREIEFFVQTQQLIRGGKNKSLRQHSTINTLKKLKANDLISPKVHDDLIQAYTQLRNLEHILQLIEDMQTHSIPNDENKVQNVAMLFGIPKTKDFLNFIFKLLTEVNNIIVQLYSQFDPIGQNHYESWQTVISDDVLFSYSKKWSSYKFLRSERAAKLFDELLPVIVLKILQTENKTNTVFYFDNFLKSLSFGVQVLSLFKVNPAVLDLLIDICGAAPALAQYVGRSPAVLEVVTDQSFFLPLPGKKELIEDFTDRISGITDYEQVLDCARVFVKENQFKTGVHLLKAFSSIPEVSQSFSNIAEVCLIILFDKVKQMFSKRYGEIAGLGPSLLAMGKLGSEELSIESDLDLILIYDAHPDTLSSGRNPVSAQVYYSRLTQAFISAITVATAEGHLFKVDMRLRPSGNNGPVATSLGSFKNYQVNEAWVWERLALSRGRVLNGNLQLRNKIKVIIQKALNSEISKDHIIKEVFEMRLRLDKKNNELSSLFDLKLGTGRLQDLEILIQMGALLNKCFKSPSPLKLIPYLNKLNFFFDDEALVCQRAYLLYSSIQQIQSITVAGQINDSSLGSINNMLKSHKFTELSENILQTLDFFSNSIDTIFKIKLHHD